MSFVYEMVGEENRELWESIGWKNWGNMPVLFSDTRYWSYDKSQNVFLIEIGGYIDMPNYYDMCYKGRIVRMEVFDAGGGKLSTGVTFFWKIKNIYVPKSIWNEKGSIQSTILDAFSVVRNLVPTEKVKDIKAEIVGKFVCVEADYNGR